MVSAGSLSLGSPEAGLGMNSLKQLMSRSQEIPSGSDGVQFLYSSGVRVQTAPCEVAPTLRKSAHAAGGKWRPVP